MLTNVKPMACGNCGHGAFEIFKHFLENDFQLIVECKSCKSTSVIGVSKPHVTIDWGENSDGCLCDMKPIS